MKATNLLIPVAIIAMTGNVNHRIIGSNYTGNYNNPAMRQRISINNIHKLIQCEYTSSVGTGNIMNEKKAITNDFKNENLKFSSVNFDNNSIEFKNPYEIKVYINDGIMYADDYELNMFSCGETIEELKREISENFIVAWKLYVDCDENELSSDAKELRTKLIGMAKGKLHGIQE